MVERSLADGGRSAPPPEVRLLLARHARTSWTGVRYCGSAADPGLDDAGRLEAAALAERLRLLGLTRPALYASTLARARETAAIVGVALGIPMVTDDRIREVDLGACGGLTFAEVSSRYPLVAEALTTRRLDFDWPAGETAAGVRKRVDSFWREVVEPATADLIVVAHGLLLAGLLAARGLPATAFPPAGCLELARDPLRVVS